MIKRLVGVLLVFAGGILSPVNAESRTVSLDYCADQFTLALLDESEIAAVSLDADKRYSYMRGAVGELPQVRPSAESVLALQPTTIVRSYGGGANAKGFYQQLGIKVVQLSYSSDLDGVRQEILRVSKELGKAARGAKLVADMTGRLNKLKQTARDRQGGSVMYMTPGGVTSGKQTMMDELISAAGLSNFEQRPGWHPLPLEALTQQQPEFVARAFFGSNHQHYWSAARHGVLRSALNQARTIELEDATTACGGWFLLDAIEQLAGAAQ